MGTEDRNDCRNSYHNTMFIVTDTSSEFVKYMDLGLH